tara:strand:- start:330 stop:494 length:165 start_codon:yes stop_codon:yes gene_type:complete
MMGGYDSDEIDMLCENLLGHTNWAYYDTLSEEQKKDTAKQALTVVFFKEPSEEE